MACQADTYLSEVTERCCILFLEYLPFLPQVHLLQLPKSYPGYKTRADLREAWQSSKYGLQTAHARMAPNNIPVTLRFGMELHACHDV